MPPSVSGARRPLRHVSRPRLLRLLRGRWKVAVFSAPAGYGKTTLAAQFSRGKSALWHRVLPEDRDPGHLLSSLILAGQRLSPPLSGESDGLSTTERDFDRDGAYLSHRFLTDLEPAGGFRWVVLDDLHVLEGAREAMRWLRHWIEASSPRVRFLLISRGDPPLPLGRLELDHRLVRLTAEELVFDEKEERRFLRANRKAETQLGTSRQVVMGWPAGIALLLLEPERTRGLDNDRSAAPATPPEDSATAPAIPTERIFRFLAEEVLSPLPGELRWSLCQAALLDVLDPALLSAILGRDRAKEVVDASLKHDLFVDRSLDPPRFHPLFRSYLRSLFDQDPRAARARRRIPSLARVLHSRGEGEGAVRLLLDSGHHAEAAHRFDEIARRRGVVRASSLEPLAHRLAELFPDQSPWSEYQRGSSLSDSRQYAEAVQHLRFSRRLFLAQRAWTEAVRCLQLIRGELLADFSADWVEPERTRIRELARRFLLACAQLALGDGRAEETMPSIERLVAEDPLDEEAHRLLFRGLAALGDLPGMRRRYRALGRRLKQELQIEPSSETEAVIRSLLSQ